MSELKLNYYDIMYEIPFSDLNLILANASQTAYEKNSKEIITVKKYKNREVPVINI